MAIKLQVGKIPQSPGVYFFKAGYKILYIGKAANLRVRLRSRILPKEVKSISWEVLGSEAEALIREAELIKKYHPKYNVLMRDDKNYFYVGFTKEMFPKIFITHQKKNGANYIGPFTEGGALRSVLKTLRRAFPYCTCKTIHKTPCLNMRIGKCLGFCCLPPHLPPYQGGDQGEVYKNNIRSIKKILSGKNKSLARQLKKEMQKLSNVRKYEEAGKSRDQIRALEHIFAHRGIVRRDMPSEHNRAIHELKTLLKLPEVNRIEAYDIANIHGKFAYGSMAVFSDGELSKNEYRLFKIRNVSGSNDPAMIREVLTRRFNHPEWPYAQVIIVDGGKQQLNAALAARPPLNPLLIKEGKGEVIKIIALTKNDRHVGDHIFINKSKQPIPLSKLPESLKNLILSLDSEAHRFAISHYRKLHRKNLFLNRKI